MALQTPTFGQMNAVGTGLKVVGGIAGQYLKAKQAKSEARQLRENYYIEKEQLLEDLRHVIGDIYALSGARGVEAPIEQSMYEANYWLENELIYWRNTRAQMKAIGDEVKLGAINTLLNTVGAGIQGMERQKIYEAKMGLS